MLVETLFFNYGDVKMTFYDPDGEFMRHLTFRDAVDAISEFGEFSDKHGILKYIEDDLWRWAIEEGVSLKFDWSSPNFSRVYLRKLQDSEVVW
jgi:hypothetical protein